MGIVVNTNVSSISASRILSSNRNNLERSMEKLSSGKRINSAADDAAGMAVAAKLKADVRSLNQAVRNANDAMSMVNTYDGATVEIESMLVRMRELAVQSANGTYTDTDRTNAQKEVTALLAEIERIADNTKFNRTTLESASLTFRVGAQSGTADDVTLTLGGLEVADLSLTGATIATAAGATTAVTTVDSALDTLAGRRADAGAFLNRMATTVAVQSNVSQRMAEALSGVQDADYAAESANLARGMVLAQAGAAVLAQANQSPEYILALLQG